MLTDQKVHLSGQYRIHCLLANTPHFSGVTIEQVYFLLMFYVYLASALALLSVIFNLEPSLMEPLSVTLSDLLQKEKRNKWHHELAFEASFPETMHVTSFHFTLSTQVTWHSARQVLDICNPPSSPIRRSIYGSMAKPDIHGQRGVMTLGKKHECFEQQQKSRD